MMVSALLNAVHAASRQHATTGGAATIREWAQFFTPPAVAELMAGLLKPAAGHVRILDPGAGTGILGIAAAEQMLQTGALTVHVVAIETEPSVREHLRSNLAATARARVGFTYEILDVDFLDFGGFLGSTVEPFDRVIANPPYYKTAPRDLRGGSTPNAYARFMAIAISLLRGDGVFSFIVPRSYTSGSYFRRFRHQFHNSVQIDRVHLFRSRSTVFREQDVLQETLVLSGTRGAPVSSHLVKITSSEGFEDLHDCSTLLVPHSRLVDPSTRECWVQIPESKRDVKVLEAMTQFESTLSTLGLAISTGPVVPFRTSEWLDTNGQAYPLLWMQNVRPNEISWPLPSGTRRPQWLSPGTPSALLVPNESMVLMRRFSAKEDSRRLIAAALDPSQFETPSIGLENHLNYVHAAGGIELMLARGLATFFNSEPVDRYFRLVNGTTQVNATEVRAMPLPDSRSLSGLPEGGIDRIFDGLEVA